MSTHQKFGFLTFTIGAAHDKIDVWNQALQSNSEQLQQLIFWFLAHPVAPNCFRRQTFHVLNSDFGSKTGVILK